MKKGIGLALVVLITTVAAASAQGAHRQLQTASAAGISCKSTLKLADGHPADRRSRLPRHRAAELGEVRRCNARRRRWG